MIFKLLLWLLIFLAGVWIGATYVDFILGEVGR